MQVDKFFRRETLKSWMWVALGLCAFAVFINLTHELGDEDEIRIFDELTLKWISTLRTPVLNGIFMDLTALGSGTILFLLSIIFFSVFLMLRDYVSIFHLAVTGIGVTGITALLKNFVERSRPDVVESLVPVFTSSYPSGHSSTAAALYLTFAIMACRHFLKWRQRLVLFGLSAFLISLVGLSRIYLGVHYPSDVLSGILLGSGWAFFTAAIISWPKSKLSAKSNPN